MKPIHCALIAVSLWAITNIVMDMKLRSYNPVVIYFGGYFVMAAFNYLTKNLFGDVGPLNQVVSSWSVIFFICLFGLTLHYGNIFFALAYRKGGNITTITTMLMLIPVLTTIFKVPFGDIPNRWQVGSIITGAMTLYLSGRGAPE